MSEIIINTQTELDAVKADFRGEIIIKGGTWNDPINVNRVWNSATVHAWNSATVHAWNSATVHASDSATVRASDSATVHASDSATVRASGSATVRAWNSATVHASGSATVHASGSATVHAWNSATVHASGSATVRAWNSATVHASGSATVHAWNSATVHAWNSATVHASDSATVRASDSATVHASGSATVRASDSATVDLLGFAVTLLMAKTAKAFKKSKTATIIKPEMEDDTKGWLSDEGIEAKGGKVILFKRVSEDWKTQEGNPNETTWKPGDVLEHVAWKPKKSECGSGKFHACSWPWFCDEFRDKKGDKYVAIEISTKDLYVWPGNRSYQHKVAFRKGKVLYECDLIGKKVKS